MRACLAVLSLVLTPALSPGSPGVHESRAPRTAGTAPLGRQAAPPLHLVWLDVSGVATGLEDVARAEVRTRLETAGRDLVWREGRGGGELRQGEILVNVRSLFLVDRQTRRPVLGASSRRPRPNPVVWVHVPSICAALGLGMREGPLALSGPRRRVLGVALGRVVAHELVHALAPSLGHGDGLMSEMLTRSQLMAPRLGLEPQAALAVHQARPGEWTNREGRPGRWAAGTSREGDRSEQAR